MAAREGQGLQIAVIIFAFLTIVLAITTYVFYAQAQTAMKEREGVNAQMASQRTELNNYKYRSMAAQLVLGVGDVTEADVDQARTAAGGSEQTADQILADFNAHKATIGSQLASDVVANYRTIQEALLAALRKKNDSVADHLQQLRDAQTQFTASIQTAQQQVTAAEEASQKEIAVAENEKKTYEELRATITKEKDDLVTSTAAAVDKQRKELDALINQRNQLLQQGTQRQTTIENLQTRISELQKSQVDLFENPDGKILGVNQRLQIASINLGRADGLLRQTTFSVYPHNEHGLASATPKARIEVINILGDHMAEARILEDKASDPIIPGDIVHTPAWSPGERIHFAMAGTMDLNGDKIDDYETVRNVILLNGGVIDAEVKPDGTRVGDLTVRTRYLVIGESPTEVTNEAVTRAWTQIQEEIKPFGIEPLPYKQLLNMMGWKAEERIVELAGSRSSQFRQRTPGKKAEKAAAEEAGAAPATTTPEAGAGGEVDPFGAPGAADPFGAPAPSTPMGADPFGTPAPGAAADPFSTP